MPCPTGSFKIISRGKGQSCMASCAYYSGEKKYSEYECCWKYPHSSPARVKQVEVMLPPNAPKAYADPQKLWNAVDAAETSVNAQTARSMLFALPRELTDEQNLAIVRDFCQKEFVDKGMVCNFFYHDKGDGNPHVHIMLTLRAMDENGKWLPKSKNVYALDENGNRIRAPNGSWKRVKVDTVDWNERKYGEIWRQDWATAQNAALEAAGRMERVDMRSLERQGVEDRLPQKHLGPTASALERKGVSSERGDENRKIISVNKMLASLQKIVRGIGAWLDELRKAVSRQQIIESPDDYPLSDVITAYLDMRRDGRETWNRYAQEKGVVHDLKDGFLPLESRALHSWSARTVHRRNSTDIFQTQGGIHGKGTQNPRHRRAVWRDSNHPRIEASSAGIRKHSLEWKARKVQGRTRRRIEPSAKGDLAARKAREVAGACVSSRQGTTRGAENRAYAARSGTRSPSSETRRNQCRIGGAESHPILDTQGHP